MEPTWYELLGREAGLARLVDRFYDLMDSREDSKTIRAMHPIDIATSNDKLYRFLVDWSGGPPIYTSVHGHPRLRARHMPFAIDDAAAKAWMACMGQALEEQVEDPGVRRRVESQFTRMANHMRNQAD